MVLYIKFTLVHLFESVTKSAVESLAELEHR